MSEREGERTLRNNDARTVIVLPFRGNQGNTILLHSYLWNPGHSTAESMSVMTTLLEVSPSFRTISIKPLLIHLMKSI